MRGPPRSRPDESQRDGEVHEGSRSSQHFLSEVRLSRQIAHPNVCRVYDIAEVDGQQFLSMEYIDGEDLKRLLRRIGRLPKEKGIVEALNWSKELIPIPELASKDPFLTSQGTSQVLSRQWGIRMALHQGVESGCHRCRELRLTKRNAL